MITASKQSLPTIEYLLKQEAKLIICSHLGRPRGQADSSISLMPVAKRLAEIARPAGGVRCLTVSASQPKKPPRS